MKRLYLLRHGETEWNADNRVQGSIDIPLSDKGKKQALTIAKYLKKLPLPQKIYSSNLIRSIETAKIVADYLKLKDIEENPLLREINCGLWEGMTTSELLRDYPEEYGLWRIDPSYRCPNGESVEDVRDRVVQFFLEKRDELSNIDNVLIVTHGLFNRAMLSFIMDLPLKQCRYFEQENGALNVFVWGEVMPHLIMWNFTLECDWDSE